MSVLFLMICAHALCDYPLQGDYLAVCKNHLLPRRFGDVPWWHAMSAHSLIHAGAVYLITGNAWLGVAEFACHFAIDYLKCDRRIGINTDQGLHLACKVIWAGLAVASA